MFLADWANFADLFFFLNLLDLLNQRNKNNTMICRELLAARLERKSFFAWTSFLLNRNLLQKRLGVEGGIAAKIILLI